MPVNEYHRELAGRALERLERTLVQQPPPGVSSEFVSQFFADREQVLRLQFHLEDLLDKAFHRKDVAASPGPEYMTPGTNLRWRTLDQWLWGAREIRRRYYRHPSLAGHRARVEHFLALPDAVILQGSWEELEELSKVVRWIRPPKGQRQGHLYTKILDTIEQRRQALRRQGAVP